MPKITLEFNLPEEQAEFNKAVRAGNLYTVIREISEHLRQRSKHGEKSPAVQIELDKLRATLHTFIEDQGVSELFE